MEKYGVVLDQDLTKTASETQTCPECGSHLNDQGFCDRHGSKPFEKEPTRFPGARVRPHFKKEPTKFPAPNK